ncbi:MAG: hypothetical protein E7300_00980 [Lachnospiraceae bacterium]|jgi:predicted  nucleic acid-binding Zn-ribbon protein|nr:hypothetical protein [Lachnospiraceae bacterium]
MKTEDLQAQGLTEEQIKFVFAENGKDIKDMKDLQKKADTLSADLENWKKRAEDAENTLKGFDGKDFDAIQKERDEWKAKAEAAEKEYKQKIYDRDFADALSGEMEKIKFSSDYAKQAVMNEIKGAGLKLIDGKIIGLGDMLETIKAKDASAFVDEAQQQRDKNKATFTQPMGGGTQEVITGDPAKMDTETYLKWRKQNM